MSNHLIQKPCLSLRILNRGVLMDVLQKGFSTSKEVALTNLAWCRIETENDKIVIQVAFKQRKFRQ